MWSDDNRFCLRAFGLVSGILGFIVDSVAFIRIFGVELIVSPTASASGHRNSALSFHLPINLEVVTFIIWLYALIVAVTFLISIDSESDQERAGCLPASVLCFFCTLLPAFLAVWLWGFAYIPAWLYVFLAPTLALMGMALFVGRYWGSDERTGCLLLLFAIGPALLWFRSGYDWMFIWIIAITFVSWMVGVPIGVLAGWHIRDYRPY